jgi:hypothetical protein
MGSPRNKDVAAAQEAKKAMEGKFAKGMLEESERTCQDKLCCLIFFLFTVACVIISGYAFASGKPSLMLTKYDSDGNECGMPG